MGCGEISSGATRLERDKGSGLNLVLGGVWWREREDRWDVGWRYAVWCDEGRVGLHER